MRSESMLIIEVTMGTNESLGIIEGGQGESDANRYGAAFRHEPQLQLQLNPQSGKCF